MAVATLLTAVPAHAAHAIVDALDGTVLEEVEPSLPVPADRALDLLLVEVVRERVATGALGYATDVAVVVLGGDPGPSLAAHARLRVGELLQLVLLARSRSAIATLAAAVGPGWERARLRMRRAAARLALRATAVPESWPGEQPRSAGVTRDVGPGAARRPAAAAAAARHGGETRTTLGELARVAAVVTGDVEIRRRLTLDGAPIADGAAIVRATDPLIVRIVGGAAAATGAPDDAPALALAERDGLALLAVACGPESSRATRQVLEHGLARYRRVELVRAGETVGADVDDRDGVAHVSVVATQSFAITVPRHGTFTVSAWLQLAPGAAAPSEANRPIGEIVFAEGGRVVGAVSLVTAGANAPSGWLDTASR